ncbi:MAG: hypothetical protein QOK48_1861 [Blastocatellia bacterium]|jgi:hypothetical protein|nr:hypothetical protein [Blastocatellia bacterium]
MQIAEVFCPDSSVSTALECADDVGSHSLCHFEIYSKQTIDLDSLPEELSGDDGPFAKVIAKS